MREMKDSGIEWIKKIPINWKINKLKYISSSIFKGQGIKKDDVDPNGTIPCIRYGEIYSKYSNKFCQCFSSINADKTSPKQPFVQQGDILLAGTGELIDEIGKNILYMGNDPCAVGGDIIVARINENPNFINFALNSCYCQNQKSCNKLKLKVTHISPFEIGNIILLIPPTYIQHKIADFLDQKCSEIDALTADIQTQIETLQEYKKSVITEAVTKGLDPNVEMKDSRCFYIGNIHKSWKVTKIGYVCKKLYRPVDEHLPPLICSNKGNVQERDSSLIGKMVSENHAMQGIRCGDIAIHGMDTWHGAIATSSIDGNITRVVHVCQSLGDNRFIVYYLQSLAYRNVYKLISNGIRGNTSDFRSWDLVKKIFLPFPSIEEQHKIANYLDNKCSDIESLIIEKQQQLETLAEYKKSLIYEYVTGKKEVI